MNRVCYLGVSNLKDLSSGYKNVDPIASEKMTRWGAMYRYGGRLMVLLLLPLHVVGKLVASVVLPHGDFALDPGLLPENSTERQAAEEVAAAASKAGKWLSTLIKPDLIILSTPHGMELTNDFAFYLGSSASGYADLGQDLHNGTSHRIKLDTISLAPNETHDLLRHLRGQAVSGILNYADSEDMALRWGEVIPLVLVHAPAYTHRRYIILSHPLRRYNRSPSMVPELLSLGKSIRDWADSRPERIALLISSDLSHTHRPDGPYGYSNASAPFDAAIQKWATSPLKNAKSLLVEATSLQDQAKSCGFTGMVMLHGSLVQDHFETKVLASRNATYYGMMVATFIRGERNVVESSQLF
jgi:aromatic ring-opening dioxygenase LigB subunit